MKKTRKTFGTCERGVKKNRSNSYSIDQKTRFTLKRKCGFINQDSVIFFFPLLNVILFFFSLDFFFFLHNENGSCEVEIHFTLNENRQANPF